MIWFWRAMRALGLPRCTHHEWSCWAKADTNPDEWHRYCIECGVIEARFP